MTDPEGKKGIRTNVPWYHTIGPEYITEMFALAREEDRQATLVLNEFGFETVNEFGDKPRDRQRATLQVIDMLIDKGTPPDALGVQAHLNADNFAERFHPGAYQRFLSEVADRGLDILITELDVLDDGLPKNIEVRDRKVASVYRRYLDAALDHPAVRSVMNFGISDKYTWLDEDYPRAGRRPPPSAALHPAAGAEARLPRAADQPAGGRPPRAVVGPAASGPRASRQLAVRTPPDGAGPGAVGWVRCGHGTIGSGSRQAPVWPSSIRRRPMSKIVTMAAVGVGYVLGARAGRQRYEQIAQGARKVWRDPRVQQAAAEARTTAAEKGPVVKERIVQAASSVGDRKTSGSGTA